MMAHRRDQQRSHKKTETLIQAINRQIWRLVAMKEILDSAPQPIDKQLSSGRQILEIRKGKEMLYKLILMPRRQNGQVQGLNGPYWYADCHRLHMRSKYVCSAQTLRRLEQNPKLMAFAFEL